MKARKPSIRSCVGCGRAADKRDIVRIVRTADGDVHVDPSGKADGRGAYVCAELPCFEAAIVKPRLAHALRATIGEEDVERLRHEYESTLAARVGVNSLPGR